MIARILLILSAVLAAAACGAQSSGGAGGSGLYGSVHLSPASPVCGANACSRPARRFRLVFARNGRVVASATTDQQGRYRVQLDRGRYLVRAGRVVISPKSGLLPRYVTVPGGRFAKRDFVYDSGVR